MEIYRYIISDYNEDDLKSFSKYCDKKNKESIVAHYFTKKYISERIGVDISEISFAYNSHGKPEYNGTCFSISHTGDYVFCGFDSKPIGIDAQIIKPVNRALLKKVATDNESEKINNSGDFDREFIRMWTIKEAYFKYIGTGITDLKSVSSYDIESLFDVFTDIDDNYILSVISKKDRD